MGTSRWRNYFAISDGPEAVLACLRCLAGSVLLDSDEVRAWAAALSDWLARTFPGGTLHCELPFSRHLPTGQWQNGQIDLALERPDGWVIVDHKSNPQPKADWLEVAARHSGQLAAYAEALEDLSGRPVLATLIHFSISGGVVEVRV